MQRVVVALMTLLMVAVAMGAVGAEETAATEQKPAETSKASPFGVRAGVGLGLQYGLLGFNVETQSDLPVALTGGAGLALGGLAWNAGIHVYFSPRNKEGHHEGFRLTGLYGTNTILESETWGGWSSDDYELLKGYTVGIGYQEKNMNFDLLLPLTDIPEGAEEWGIPVKLSFGVMF